MLQHESENVLPNLKVPDMTTLHSRRNEKLNSGRWKADEHNKFLSAIIEYGNDWKLVQKCIKSRSSTQARSHAQKFLLKLRKKLKIEPDNSNKLSKESIDKIVKEIVEASAHKNNPYFDKEKLVKLIMGFSNLLVGRISPPMGSMGGNNNEYQQNNNYNSYSNDPFFDCGNLSNSPYQQFQSNFFVKEESRKVFNIEKIYKGNHHRNTNTNTNTEGGLSHLFISNSTKPLDSSQLFSGGELNLPKNSFNISQINNQNDFLKFLLNSNAAAGNQDSSQGSVINIFSINICKNEGDANVPTFQPNMIPGLLTANTTASNTPYTKKTPQPDPAMTSRINLNFAKSESSSLPVNKVCSSKLISSANTVAKPAPTNVNNNKSASSSASSNSQYERDFYDNSNSSGSYFNNQNDEDIDKYFVEWN